MKTFKQFLGEEEYDAIKDRIAMAGGCLLYTSPSPRD